MGDQSKNLIKTPLALFPSEVRCISQHSVNVTNDGEFFLACCLLPATVYLDTAGPPRVPLTLLLAT